MHLEPPCTIYKIWSVFEFAFSLKVTRSFDFVCDSSDRRLADHFGGKLHLGYMQIREKLADLQVRLFTYSSICIELFFF